MPDSNFRTGPLKVPRSILLQQIQARLATQWEKQLFNGTVVTVEDRRYGAEKEGRPNKEQ